MGSQDEWANDSPSAPDAHFAPAGLSLGLSLVISTTLHLVLLLALGVATSGITGQHIASTSMPGAIGHLSVQLPNRHRQPDETPGSTTAVASSQVVPEHAAANPRIAESGTGELSRPPELIDGVPEAIAVADAQQASGQVRLLVSIDRSGKATEIHVLSSNLPRSIEGMIVSRFFHARYRPGEVSGIPVESTMEVSAEFSVAPSDANGPQSPQAAQGGQPAPPRR